MDGTARSGSHLPEKSDCRIRQFARTGYHFKQNCGTKNIKYIKMALKKCAEFGTP